MSGPQIIRTPGGEELVVLSRAEYEALLERADHEAEDADGVAIYDARKAAGEGVLPPEVSAAILRGESRLKAIRNWRDETQLHLSFKTGIGQGLSVRSRKWTPRRDSRDHREARPSLECPGGVAFLEKAERIKEIQFVPAQLVTSAAGAAFAPPLDTATSAGRSTRSPIMKPACTT
jgi:hypothetical protein